MVGSPSPSPDAAAAVNDDNTTSSAAAVVSCSICLDLVADHGERSVAKLQCGHEFHLDCIGSAFNMKGLMQCPNCRKVEKGGWLFANGSAPSIPEIGEEDWIPDEDPISYSEMPFGVPWCPFGGFTVHSAFEEVESFSSTSPSSMAGSYFAYLRPMPAAISNTSENVDDANFSHHLNGQSGHGEVYSAQAFPTTYIPHHGWVRHSPPFSATGRYIDGGDQALAHPPTQRSARIGSDPMARSGSFVGPFRYSQGSNPRLHGRIQVSHTNNHHRQQANNVPSITSSINPGYRRFSLTRGLPMVVPSIRTGGFYVLPPSGFSGRTLHEPENPLPNHHVHAWERNQSHFPATAFDRDPGWGPLRHSAGGGSDHSSNRTPSSWHPQWS